MQAFFKELAEKDKDELSATELDMVAGGKDSYMLTLSLITIGLGCAALSLLAELASGACKTAE